jgi:hypothetical protein
MLGVSLEFKYEWEPVESISGTLYRFPSPVVPRMARIYDRPAVYRWVFLSPTGQTTKYYFGETQCLAGRIKQYLTPGKSQPTNIRLNEHLRRQSKLGLAVGMETVKLESIVLNDSNLGQNPLNSVFLRKALENLLIAEFHNDPTASEIELLNRPTTVSGRGTKEGLKKIRDYLKKLSPEERQEILRKAEQ